MRAEIVSVFSTSASILWKGRPAGGQARENSITGFVDVSYKDVLPYTRSMRTPLQSIVPFRLVAFHVAPSPFVGEDDDGLDPVSLNASNATPAEFSSWGASAVVRSELEITDTFGSVRPSSIASPAPWPRPSTSVKDIELHGDL